MADAHANFAVSTVATAPSPASSGTSLVVASGHGTRFPAVPFNATVWPASTKPDPSNAEIVRVTARTTDTLTITRAQESSSARTVVVGDQIAATITAKTLTDVEFSSWKDSVRAATTVNGTLASAYENGDTIDGVVLATNDRILIKNQTTGGENGIYTVNASGAPTRATDCDTGAEALGAVVPVREGTVNADAVFLNTTDVITTFGTTATVWAYYPSGTELASLPTASVPILATDTVPIIQSGVVGQVAASALLPTDVQVFAGTGGTYTKPAGTIAVRVMMISSGSGGGSGRRGATSTLRGGGGGGCGGAFTEVMFRASQVGATETVTVPAGGAGGAGVTADSTNGNIGVDATATSFGSLLSIVSGFSTLTPGGAGTSAIGGAGGLGIIPGNIQDSAAGGAGSNGTAAAVTGAGGKNAGAGGTGGGGVSAANAGTNGLIGGSGGAGVFQAQGGSGGAAGATGSVGGAGQNSTVERGGGSGGGGGGGTTNNGGAGAASGTYGAGGSGSGGGTNGTTGGAGAAGSAGIVIVISFR